MAITRSNDPNPDRVFVLIRGEHYRTGIAAANLAPDAPAGSCGAGGINCCRNIYSVRYDGSGLGTAVVNGVVALLNAIMFDVYVQARPDVAGASPASSVDAVNAFIDRIQPSPGGGTDPVTRQTCVTFNASQLFDKYTGPKAAAGTDGIQEMIRQLNPGPLYCFNVVPKTNTTIPAQTYPQLFRVLLSVKAENGTSTLTLGADRAVFSIIPPLVP